MYTPPLHVDTQTGTSRISATPGRALSNGRARRLIQDKVVKGTAGVPHGVWRVEEAGVGQQIARGGVGIPGYLRYNKQAG